jgi:ubiquinone/menaquinone biosynthesis C-methylase UbiE
MEAKLQRRIQRYGWDRAVEHYEHSWSRQLAPAQELLLEMAEPQPGEHVLDVACGTGLVTLPAARAVGPEGRLVATDISEGMVGACRAAAQNAGLNWVEFARLGAENLDLPEGSFDVILCALGLMYVPDPTLAMRQMWRASKPGGRAAVAVWGARKSCGWAGIFPVVDERVNTQVCPLFFDLGTGDAMADTLSAAGFEDIISRRISTVLEYESTDEALGAAFAGGPVAMAYSRFDDATRQEAHAEYLATIEGFRNGSGYRIPGEFVVVRGRRP